MEATDPGGVELKLGRSRKGSAERWGELVGEGLYMRLRAGDAGCCSGMAYVGEVATAADLRLKLMMVSLESRVPGLPVWLRGPKSLSRPRPYVLLGVFFSGSGAHESTGRWSEGSISRPSHPTMGPPMPSRGGAPLWSDRTWS